MSTSAFPELIPLPETELKAVKIVLDEQQKIRTVIEEHQGDLANLETVLRAMIHAIIQRVEAQRVAEGKESFAGRNVAFNAAFGLTVTVPENGPYVAPDLMPEVQK